MATKVTDYWALAEPALGETKADPGGLARRVEVDDGVVFEVLVGNRWQDRTPALIWLTMAPDHANAEHLTAEEATELERTFPWPHARYGFRRQREGDNPPQGTPLPKSKGRKTQSEAS